MPAQGTVRRHECDLTFGIGRDRQEGVVTAAGRMQDGDAIGHPSLDAGASGSFEDDDDGFGKSARSRRRTNSLDERSGCSWSIPPPAVRPRADHVRSIDEQHDSSIAVAAIRDTWTRSVGWR